MSEIDPSTIKAYRETNYYIAAPAPFVLRVGVTSEALARICAQHRTDCCAFVTASNPYSRLVDDQENADRQAGLARELERRGLTFFHGTGRHPSGSWPAESSYLVLGLSLADAKMLGEAYQQNAILWCGPDAVPELILLR
ncbi:MAG TPA: DUF3293 domain-containing protein [Gallionella sp.]|nr:DUF3293 domain-containing protein [Gallionella sp.]